MSDDTNAHVAQVRHLVETRTGKVYEHNYDRFVALDDVPLFAVIDSECDDGTAGDIVRRSLLDAAPSLKACSSAEDAQRVLTLAVHSANQAVMAARSTSARTIGGCSIVACTYRRGFVYGVHVGECRVLQLQAAEWRPITSEHTLFNLLRGQPHEYPPDVDLAQSKRVIVRAVGLTSTLEVDTFRIPVAPKSSVMLCSPGAWAPLDSAELGIQITACPTDSAIVAFALGAYSRAGELDNFTMIHATFALSGPVA